MVPVAALPQYKSTEGAEHDQNEKYIHNHTSSSSRQVPSDEQYTEIDDSEKNTEFIEEVTSEIEGSEVYRCLLSQCTTLFHYFPSIGLIR